jgi:hypothetical protein
VRNDNHRKTRFPFYAFLAAARVEFITLQRAHGLEISAETAFNNMIVHPVDHWMCKQQLLKHVWSMDLSGSFESYMRSRFFTLVLSGPLLNPLCPERLADLDPEAHPFHAQLYEHLHAINPVLARHGLTSCSF